MESAFFKNVEAPTVVGDASLIALIIGLVLMVVAALIIIGGLQRIAAVAERVVPFMAIAYVVGCLVILFVHIGEIGAIFGSIFKFGFGIKAVGGAVAGCDDDAVFRQTVLSDGTIQGNLICRSLHRGRGCRNFIQKENV